MMPQNRIGNRYLVSFIDHKSNYCRMFLARTKDATAKQFEAFLTLISSSAPRSMSCAPMAAESTPISISFARGQA